MRLPEMLQRLGFGPADAVAHDLWHRLAARSAGAVPADWQALAAVLGRSLMPGRPAGPPWPSWDEVAAPLVLGIGGGQGAGKSTLAAQLEQALAAAGARAVACSLDDFYLSHARRRELAGSVHPLLATRGVPGTHDIPLLLDVIAGLGGSGEVAIPVFDKAADDIEPPARWRRISAPVDVLVLEGWCVGARPQSEAALDQPVNALELREDPDGTWRRYVNAALSGPYARAWARLHALVFLQVPGLDAVLRWRTCQEQAVPAAKRMTDAALERFVAHYERITRTMLADLPGRAALTVRLDESHAVADFRRGAGDAQ